MCCAINRYALNLPLALVLTIVFLPRLRAQLNTGLLQATFYSPDGVRAGALPILITGAAGFRIVTQSTESGEVFAVLPYGRYRLSIPDQEGLFINVFVPPLQTLKIDLTLTVRGLSRMAASPESAGL